MSMTPQELLEDYTQAIWHDGDLDAVDRYFAPGYVSHDPVEPQVEGAEAFKEYVASLRIMFPDIHFTWDDVISEGDKIVGRWTLRGTQLGPAPTLGIEATGRRVEVSGITIFQIEDDKIVADWETWDRLKLLQQLGVAP
jgi:steroid delta-isomerase-like uncharacterized protein